MAKKDKYLKIPIPKWKWWQTTLFIVSVILAIRMRLGEDAKAILKTLLRIMQDSL